MKRALAYGLAAAACGAAWGTPAGAFSPPGCTWGSRSEPCCTASSGLPSPSAKCASRNAGSKSSGGSSPGKRPLRLFETTSFLGRDHVRPPPGASVGLARGGSDRPPDGGQMPAAGVRVIDVLAPTSHCGRDRWRTPWWRA
jgi:hypothetical protein